jgi:protein-S-isoprenylcysteine O-methyltransferase Ste14
MASTRASANPIYVFGTLVIVGIFLFLERPLLLLLLVPILILQIIRARAEAHVLEQHFGDKYRQYKATTWFCPPRKSSLTVVIMFV